MPTYAYACTACDHRFEVQQSFTDAALSECPQCDGRVRKLFNAVGIVFKGSGFYRTDSRGSNSIPSGSGDKASAGSTSGNGSASTAGSTSGSTEKSSSGSSTPAPATSSATSAA